MQKLLELPLNASTIMKKKKSIKRELMQEENFIDLRVAILGGSTTSEIKAVLELFLLEAGIKPIFYESEYNKWYEDAVFENQELETFKPQIIYIHTSFVNIEHLPAMSDKRADIDANFALDADKLTQVWKSLATKYQAIIIQNNFELPSQLQLGNQDAVKINGYINYVNRLNQFVYDYSLQNNNFYINDINYLSANYGLDKWHDRDFYNLYKFALSYDAIPYLAYNLGQLIKASVGKTKKCLVLDLDNTLWGGVIGDDGVNGIQLGHETAVGESFVEFQRYVAKLKERGVILAVCSKNDFEIAKSGFTHPDSVLKVGDFASFITNWEPKHLNLLKVAKEINIGLDSLVFIDDNPVERQIIKEQLPEVIVPEVVAGEPSSYIEALEQGKYFEQLSISDDDLKRNKTYLENKKRNDLEREFTSYDDFLRSLDMKAEIKSFIPMYLDRITQLTNKTNQFNLTTKRYTRGEIEAVADNKDYITLYGRLKDKFGDNGLVSVVVGRKEKDVLHIDLWLMSCRVLKRDFEFAMFNELVKLAKEQGIQEIRGYYYRTAKNNMVADLYEKLEFKKLDEDGTEWNYLINESRKKMNIPITINGEY